MKWLPKLKLSPRLVNLAFKFFETPVEEMIFTGSRVVEYSFVIQKLTQKETGTVLDVGCTYRFNYLAPTLASLGWEIYGIDGREFKLYHPNFHFTLGDIRNTTFKDNFFYQIYAVSMIEHIGMKGEFGISEDDIEGDQKAIKEMRRIIHPNGNLILTTEYGKADDKHDHRVYNKRSIEQLFSQWTVNDEAYYTRDAKGFFIRVEEEVAAQVEEWQGDHAIALYELSPNK